MKIKLIYEINHKTGTEKSIFRIKILQYLQFKKKYSWLKTAIYLKME